MFVGAALFTVTRYDARFYRAAAASDRSLLKSKPAALGDIFFHA